MSHSPLLFRTVVALFSFKLTDINYPRVVEHVRIEEKAMRDVVQLLLIT